MQVAAANGQWHGSSSQGGVLAVFGTIGSCHASLEVCRYLRLVSELH